MTKKNNSTILKTIGIIFILLFCTISYSQSKIDSNKIGDEKGYTPLTVKFGSDSFEKEAIKVLREFSSQIEKNNRPKGTSLASILKYIKENLIEFFAALIALAVAIPGFLSTFKKKDGKLSKVDEFFKRLVPEKFIYPLRIICSLIILIPIILLILKLTYSILTLLLILLGIILMSSLVVLEYFKFYSKQPKTDVHQHKVDLTHNFYFGSELEFEKIAEINLIKLDIFISSILHSEKIYVKYFASTRNEIFWHKVVIATIDDKKKEELEKEIKLILPDLNSDKLTIKISLKD